MSKYVEIEAPRGNAWLMVVEGQVSHHQSQRWSETRLHSSGGGGYVDPKYGGYVAPPTVYSTAVEHEQTVFWVEEPNGQEHQVSLRNSSFAVAPGHRVRISWGGTTRDQNNGDYLFAHNFNSGHTVDFQHGAWWRWANHKGLIRHPLLYRAIVDWIPALLALYCLVVWLPLLHRMPPDWLAHTFGAFAHDPKPATLLPLFNASSVGNWSPTLLTSTLYPSRELYLYGAGGAFLLWLITHTTFSFIGNLFFGRWWRSSKTLSFRDAFMSEFNKPLDSVA